MGAEAGDSKSEFLQLEVSIVDAEGNPVAGVTVTPWALGSAKGHGLWRDEVFGEPGTVETDESGRALIRYPAEHFDGESTNVVSVHVDHLRFVHESVHLQTPAGAAVGSWGDPPELTLRAGTRLRAAVVRGESDELLPDAHIMFAGEVPQVEIFRAGDDGWLESRPLPEEWKWLRAVWLNPDGPPQFSERYQWLPGDEETHEFALSVVPGTRLEARLDDTVPRPVAGGRACLFVTDPLTDPPSTVWADVVEISADGTFAFESLPRGCDAQIVAMCDGYYSPSPAEPELLSAATRYDMTTASSSGFLYPQLFTLDRELITATVQMQPTAECRVLVIDQNELPVADVLVGFWPNQVILGSGSMIYGNGYSTASLLRSGEPEIDTAEWFNRTTDEDGQGEFENLIPGAWSFGVYSPDLQRELSVSGGAEATELTVEVGSPLDRTIVLSNGADSDE